MSCDGCSLPESLCVCGTAGPAMVLPQEEVALPSEAKPSRAYEEAVDLSSFRRIAGLDESERKDEFVALAKDISWNGDKLLKALQQDQKNAALKALMLTAMAIKKMALAYAMEPAADAAEKLADELDKASRSF